MEGTRHFDSLAPLHRTVKKRRTKSKADHLDKNQEVITTPNVKESGTSILKHPVDVYESVNIQDFSQFAELSPTFSQEYEKLKLRRENYTKESKCLQNEIDNKCYSWPSCFGTHVNFDFNVALTRVILKSQYGGLILPSMPENRLCPPIPNRYNYVQWIQNLVTNKTTDTEFYCKSDCMNKRSKELEDNSYQLNFQGIDIGTGASCIYPLLLSYAFSKNWKFFATEIDQFSYESAVKNVKANSLQDRIFVSFVNQTDLNTEMTSNDFCGPVRMALNTITVQMEENCPKSFNTKHDSFDFCMVNPPFYTNLLEYESPRRGDSRDRTAMTLDEAIYPRGGEFAFIHDMIYDSLHSRLRITWYTSLVGKKETLYKLEKTLVELGFGRGNIRVAEFIQGKKGLGRRWGIAWTYMEAPIRSPATRLIISRKIVICIETREIEGEGEKGEIDVRSFLSDAMYNRIYEYCEYMQTKESWHLKVSNDECYEKDSHEIAALRKITIVGKSISCNDNDNVINGNAAWVKQHFIIDVTVLLETSDKIEKISKSWYKGAKTFILLMQCYCHTPRASQMVNKFQNQIEGEIQRTNRRWRRKKGIHKGSQKR